GATGVEVYDDARTFNDVYTVTGTTLSRPSFGGLAYHDAKYVLLIAGSGNNTVNVNGTSVPTYLYMGAGNDTVNMGTANLGTILGAVTVVGEVGTDAVRLFDQSSPYAGPYTITNTLVNAPGSFVNGVSYFSVENVTLNAAAGNNVINVDSL